MHHHLKVTSAAVFVAVFVFSDCVLQVTGQDKFSCEGRASGYYADVDTGCQVYHMCDGLGRQFSYSCPNTTLFQQRMLICDHWYMVNCSRSVLDYEANLLIGQRDKPFVEDSSEKPYQRTPRPDLLAEPYAPFHQDSDAYRRGKSHGVTTHNLVGVVTDEGNYKGDGDTDEPQYVLPSHWTLEYGRTPNSAGRRIDQKSANSKIQHVKASKPEKKPFLVPSTTLPNLIVGILPNFNYTTKLPESITSPSLVESTTYPTFPSKKIIPTVPPTKLFPTALPAKLPPTTFPPKLLPRTKLPPTQTPSTVPPSPNPVPTSFSLPPNVSPPSIYYEPPKLQLTINMESTTMDPQTFYRLVPSKDLQPPKLPSPPETKSGSKPDDQTESTTTNPRGVTKKETASSLSDPNQESISADQRWMELRKMFFIPEYDFPLEIEPRPSYEGGVSSFQVSAGPQESSPLDKDNQKKTNVDCPKCDPAFLVPGTCKPCVMIR